MATVGLVDRVNLGTFIILAPGVFLQPRNEHLKFLLHWHSRRRNNITAHLRPISNSPTAQRITTIMIILYRHREASKFSLSLIPDMDSSGSEANTKSLPRFIIYYRGD